MSFFLSFGKIMKIIPVSKYPLTLLEREHLKISEVIKFKGDMSKERDLLDIAPQSCIILQSFVIIIGGWI